MDKSARSFSPQATKKKGPCYLDLRPADTLVNLTYLETESLSHRT